VSRSWLGRPSIRYEPARQDLELVRTAARRMAENYFALGATRVFPQIHGVPPVLERPGEAASIENAALDPRAYPIALTHLFGTCRMGSDPRASVVAPGFNVHGTRNLLVVDASCFPTNLGVNPQSSIMTLARIAARRAIAELGR
jgi:choline dehydrogenase-like flavoprotein